MKHAWIVAIVLLFGCKSLPPQKIRPNPDGTLSVLEYAVTSKEWLEVDRLPPGCAYDVDKRISDCTK